MSDVKCPYCGEDQEINHDDGYGYEDGGEFEQDCVSCEKTFKFSTSISFSYIVYCQDGDHDIEPWTDHKGMYGCKKCEFCELRRDEI